MDIAVEFGILGPVQARRDGRDLPVGGPKQRALLAMLLLRANQPVSRDALIEGLWAERPPASAGHTLDDYVSRLRKALGPDRIERHSPGYLLRVHPGELDLDRFERQREKGRTLLAAGDPRGAATALRAALALWRGPALADVLFEPFAQVDAARLEERRLNAIDEATEAELEQGAGAELVAELESRVRESPLRERPVGHLMRALYRAGRQAEALAAYQSWRRLLASELGLDPGPQLRELEHRILAQDPSLLPARPRPSRVHTGGRRRRRGVVLMTAAVIALVGVALGVALTPSGGGAHESSRSPQLVAVRTGSGSLAAALSLIGAPAALASAGSSLWLAEPDVGEVTRVDLRSGTVEERIPVGGAPGAIAAGGGSVWVASVPGRSVSRIDPATDAVTQTIALGGASIDALAFGVGGLWLADTSDDALIEINPLEGSVERTIQLGFRPTALSAARGALWVADYDNATVAEIDPQSRQIEIQLRVGTGPADLAFGDGSLWVANSLDSTVSRIDPARGSVVATIQVGSDPTAVVLTGGSVWTADQYSREISRIDPRSYAVHALKLAGDPTGLEAVGGRLWIGVRPTTANRGGTLVLLHTRPITTDPALQVDLPPLQSDGFTRDNLVTYNHVGGPQGIALVPDLAIGLPAPSADGRTYTFRLRPGIRYSNGQPVRAGDFRRALMRVFRLRSPGASLFAGLVGGRACLARPATCDLSRGVVTDDSTGSVSFRLSAPDADFLVKLTYGALSSPVPEGTPVHAGKFPRIPGTGPYEIARADRHEILYVRNPYFREWVMPLAPVGRGFSPHCDELGAELASVGGFSGNFRCASGGRA